MKLDWLEDFLALSREGNFTRAAEQRNVAQPAFSRRVRMLEEWVGTALIDRTQQPVQLTDSGKLFLPTAEGVVNQLRLGRENVVQAQRGRQTLKFAATHTISILFFPRWLQAVAGPENELSLSLESNHMETCARLLSQGLCQFMLCYTHQDADLGFDEEKFESKVVANDFLIPLCAPDRAGSPLHPLPGSKNDPARYLYFSQASALGQVIDTMLARHADAKFVHKSSSSPLAAALKSMAESGLGIAWIAGVLAEPALRDGSLVNAGDESWSIPMEIKIFRSNSARSQAADAFWASVPCQAKSPTGLY
jgi:LysR family transcriptional regulator, hypochlorite-specific transcription factor HypT